MKEKFLTALLIITSLLGYLEWGQGQHAFLFQAEAEVVSKFFSNPLSALHPFTVLPLLGQLLLLISLFLKNYNRWLTFTGMMCVGLLLLFMLFIGVLDLNVKIIVSTLPFILVSVYIFRQHRLRKNRTAE